MGARSTIVLLALLAVSASLNGVLSASGSFFQMTDMHLDQLYVYGASLSEDCHRGNGAAGYYGTRWVCDAPETLVSAMPKFNLAGQPDFVVWTGDNARHDADRAVPRTASDIYNANAVVASMMKTMGVPLVPSIGNNDVYPHDTLCFGPNDPNLGNLSSIWSSFIPPSQQQTFLNIGSYWTTVRPNIIVVSLNTMAMFKKNHCASGCHSGEPGSQVLDFLHDVLASASASGARVYISGHVPPVPDFWHNKCLESYSKLVTKFQNTIAGHLFAHTHQDNYAILQDPLSGQANAVINIAPSGLSSYNPSIRQYLYDTNSGLLTDYVQFYANLTQINSDKILNWQQEYRWSSTYGYRDWSLNNWIDLDQRISQQSSVRNTYLTYRYVSSGLTQFMACSSELAEAGSCVLHLDKHQPHI